MKYLSLFSGIGGFELGIKQAYGNNLIQGIEETGGQDIQPDGNSPSSPEFIRDGRGASPTCIGYSEIDKYATQIYEKHFNHHNYGDITQIKAEDLPEFDLLVGGFPCQSFSIAGKRGGFNDTRGTLFFDIARILKAKQPRLFLLENVKGLLSHDEGRTFATIISTLDELGYDIQWQVLNSKNFGVPQNRERVFIIGHLRGTSRPKVFPFGTETDMATEPEQPTEVQIASTLAGSGGHIANGEYKGMNLIKVRKIVENKNKVSERDDGNSFTLTGSGRNCGSNQGLMNIGSIRRLTPTECERLQGFPDDWTEGVSDTQRYKCCGNAVTVNVIQAIMDKILIHR